MNYCRRYQRTMQNNYTILETDKNGKSTSYQERMLVENNIVGLLPVKISYIDEKKEYYYEISNKISLKKAYEKEKLEEENLYGLLIQMGKIIEQLGNYMLEDEKLLVGPEDIYVSIDRKTYYFLFFPDKKNTENKAASEDFIETTEFLIQAISQEDMKAVKIAYMLEKKAKEENFSLLEFINLLGQMKMNDQVDEIENSCTEEYRQEKEGKRSKPNGEQKEGIAAHSFKKVRNAYFGKRLLILGGLAVAYIMVANLIVKSFMYDYEKSILLMSLLIAVTIFCIIQTAIDIAKMKNENKRNETESDI